MGKVVDPIPYPDAPALDLGGAVAKRQPINQIVTYKSLEAYSQPAWMDKVVADGKLPAVKDRLPKEPQVVLTSGMKDGPGEYGDLWRGFSACPTAGWNRMAGVSAGWFGIESYSTQHQSLVKVGPLFRADQDIEPFPNLAKSWEWSSDGFSLTMKLIEGAKWSDGAPFTADDVIFTWEAYVSDPNVNSMRSLDAFKYEGKDAKLEKVDDYTIKFTFGVANPLGVYNDLSEYAFCISPMHVLKEFHPKFSTKDPKPSYTDFENAMPADKLPIATMGPWAPTEYKTDELMILRRNPYYWAVDEKGQQRRIWMKSSTRKAPAASAAICARWPAIAITRTSKTPARIPTPWPRLRNRMPSSRSTGVPSCSATASSSTSPRKWARPTIATRPCASSTAISSSARR